MYHLHLTYVKGASSKREAEKKVGAQPQILHYVSTDILGAWTFKGAVSGIEQGRDPHIVRLPR